MPKLSLTLNGFNGGINEDADPSDLKADGQGEDEVTISKNLFLDERGKIIGKYPSVTSVTSEVDDLTANDDTAENALVYNDKFYQHQGVYKMDEFVNWNANSSFLTMKPSTGSINPETPAENADGIDISWTSNRDEANDVIIFLGKGAIGHNYHFRDKAELLTYGGYIAPASTVNRYGKTGSIPYPGKFLGWGVGNTQQGSYTNDDGMLHARGSAGMQALARFDGTDNFLSAENTTDQEHWDVHAAIVTADRSDGSSLFNESNFLDASDDDNSDTLDITGIYEMQMKNCGTGLTGSVGYGTSNDNNAGIFFKTGFNYWTHSGGGAGDDVDVTGPWGVRMPSIAGMVPAIEIRVDLPTTGLNNLDGIYVFAANKEEELLGLSYTSKGDATINSDVKSWFLPREKIVTDGAAGQWGTTGENDFVRFILNDADAETGSSFSETNVRLVGITYRMIGDYDGGAYDAIRVKELSWTKVPTSSWGTGVDGKWALFQTQIDANGTESVPNRMGNITSQHNSQQVTLYKPSLSTYKGKLYYQDLDDAGALTGDKFLIAEFSYADGVKAIGNDTFETWIVEDSAADYYSFVMDSTPTYSTYQLESGFPEDTSTINSLWKASATIGRQVYIGNCGKEAHHQTIDASAENITTNVSSKTILRAKRSWTGATAIITIGATPTTNDTVVIISATGVKRTYTAKTSNDDSALEFINDSTANAAAGLAAAINHANGHSATISAVASGSVVTLVQKTGGVLGNTTISVTDPLDYTIDGFSGGENSLTTDHIIYLNNCDDNDGLYNIASFSTTTNYQDTLTITETMAGVSNTSTINSGLINITAFNNYDGSLILKSAIGQAAGFSDLQYIDLEFGGDVIKRMESAGDRLLVFSENKLTIINVAQDIEFVEAEFDYYGVAKARQVCKVGEGVAFVNTTGVYFFDGKEIKDLSEEKLNTVEWSASECAIGYDSFRKLLWVWLDSNEQYYFSFKTGQWIGKGTVPSALPVCNVAPGPDGYSYYKFSTTAKYLGKSTSATGANRDVELVTGKISCGNIARKKKFYKLYIRCNENGANVRVYVETDTYNKALIQTGLSDGENTISLSSVTGKWITIYLDDASNNVKSAIEISDISIIFRERNLK
tara:strand:+ start:383 stop:3748 length:3366 start_codon:yes stop_codon:yes gene_type:complete